MNDVISDQMAEAQAALDIPKEVKQLPRQGEKKGEIFTQSKDQIGDESQDVNT